MVTAAVSIITSFTAGVLLNEYLHWRREKARREERAAEAGPPQPVVREEEGFWLIEYHLDAQSFGTAPMMGGVVELGVKDGRVWVRRLWLPKEKYSREAVDRILASMQKCRLCKTGMPIEENYINPVKEENIRESMPVARDAGFIVGGAFLGKVVNDAMDYFLVGRLGSTNAQIAKILAGAAMILVPFGVSMSRDFENLLISAGGYLTTNAVDLIKQFVPSAPATRVTLRPVRTAVTPSPTTYPRGGYNAAALTE